MPITSPTAARLAHAKQIVCNAPAYAHRPHILRAAAERIRAARRAEDVETVTFQFPQASLNQREADAEQARRASRAMAKAVFGAGVVALILTVGIARTAHHGALGMEATLAKAEALRGM